MLMFILTVAVCKSKCNHTTALCHLCYFVAEDFVSFFSFSVKRAGYLDPLCKKSRSTSKNICCKRKSATRWNFDPFPLFIYFMIRILFIS